MAYICRNYNEARANFALRGAVRSQAWQPNERPLDDKPRKEHKLIEGSNEYGKYYDVKLYSTTMARFYEPKVEDGKRVERRLYMGHASQTSQQFMRHTLSVDLGLNIHWTPEDRDNQPVWPIYTKHFKYDGDEPFSLDACFVNGVIDPARSQHTPHYRLVADSNVRQFKQRVATHFEPYIMLALMRMPEFRASCNLDYRLGQRFGGEGFQRHYYQAIQELWQEPEPRQVTIDTFFEMCQKAYDVIASKRGMEQPDFNIKGHWYSRTQTNSSIDELAKPIEMPEFRRAILDRIHKYVGSNSMKQPEEVKQFVKYSEYPRSNIHT